MKRFGKKGISALGTLVAVMLLAAFGSGVIMMTATNQVTRNQVLYMEQSFYSAQAAFAHALWQINHGGDPNPIPTRQFKGTTLTLTRTGNEIRALTSFGDASSSLAITDPNPP